MIEVLAGQGQDVKRCCDMLAVSNSGYYAWKGRPPSAAALRRTWLGGLILDIHAASDETYGSRRVTAELRLARAASRPQHGREDHARDLELRGLPARKRGKSGRINLAGTRDLVKRDFDRGGPNRLWMTDITEHPTREGKLYCSRRPRRVVAQSRRLVDR